MGCKVWLDSIRLGYKPQLGSRGIVIAWFILDPIFNYRTLMFFTCESHWVKFAKLWWRIPAEGLPQSDITCAQDLLTSRKIGLCHFSFCARNFTVRILPISSFISEHLWGYQLQNKGLVRFLQKASNSNLGKLFLWPKIKASFSAMWNKKNPGWDVKIWHFQFFVMCVFVSLKGEYYCWVREELIVDTTFDFFRRRPAGLAAPG